MTTITEPRVERMRFFPRQLIAADDLNRAQEYHREKLREHNRMLHGWGVVCGCDVDAAPTAQRPWQVRVGPGYVVTPQGDTVSISADVLFDLATCGLESKDPCAFARPCPPITARRIVDGQIVYVAVRYAECESRPVRVAAAGCSCDDAPCEYSRVVEAFELTCLDRLPDTHKLAPVNCEEVLNPRISPCTPCPDDPWVVLATVRLPNSLDVAVSGVDPIADRRGLASAASLNEMVRCLGSQ